MGHSSLPKIQVPCGKYRISLIHITSFLICVCRMEDMQDLLEDMQDLLFAALKKRNREEAKRILIEHPELTNMKRTDEFEQEVTTPLIDACRYGKCTWRKEI